MKKTGRAAALTAFFVAGLGLGATAQAQQPQQVLVPSTVVFNASTGFTYNYSITNATIMDLAIITLPADPSSALMNLIAPTGFGISFDPGVGLVSFFEDNDPNTPNTFAPASTVPGFSFTSFFAPGTVTFDALDVSGNEYMGPTQSAAVVPEPTPTMLLLAGFALVGGTLVRRRHSQPALIP